MNRRRFIKTAAAAAFVSSLPRAASAEGSPQGMPRRILGHTNESVSLVGIGGAHLGMTDEGTAIRIVRTALDSGVNFLDNSWDYGGGECERRMGDALRDGYRARAFLMTKLDARTAVAAAKQLDESLSRLQVDHVDLLQIHEVIRMSDVERVFAPGGTIEALVKAKQQGKFRYIGFTGHKSPAIHLHMLETADRHGFVFDTVQMPVNLLDAHYESFCRQVLPVLVKKNIGVLGMKPMASGYLLKTGAASAPDCLRFAMNLPVSVCITGCDSLPVLQQALDTARSFQPLSQDEVATMLAKTAAVAQGGRFELYKTTDQFDSTTRNPALMG
jgi:predicted aldo/keto reductase-like oxidoreductase